MTAGLLASLTVAQFLEGVMLVCFGASWPFSILKVWRTKRTEGKSLLFILLILGGYLAGLGAKLSIASRAGTAPEPVIWLYLLNAVLVSVDLGLYLTYRSRSAGVPVSAEPPSPPSSGSPVD